MRGRESKRCEECWQKVDLCYCKEITRVETRTKITIVMHAAERYKTSNTARLLELMLPNCSVHLVGVKGAPFAELPARKSNLKRLLLFPDPSAPVLTTQFCENLGGIELIVPDGTWAQAKRIAQRRERLGEIATVRIEPKESKYRLRRTVHKGTLCTAEAVAYALGAIEGQMIEDKTLALLKIMTERILLSRASSRRKSI